MGLSRNKVAVSEGAAGSPPFYGEREISEGCLVKVRIRREPKGRRVGRRKSDCCSIFRDCFLEVGLITHRVHPFPFRTRKLSCAVPTILHRRRCGKIGQGQHRSLTGWKQSHYGGVAQLGEHLPCKQGVKGSNPFISTTPNIHIGS